MKKGSFFERLTGVVKTNDEDEENFDDHESGNFSETSDDEPEGQLSVDMYQTPTDLVVKAMVAGVKGEDLDISITRDMITIKGRREEQNDVAGSDYFNKELYWGAFSRTLVLPQEIEVEEAEATNKNGLLTIRLPKLDKHKQAKVKVKSV